MTSKSLPAYSLVWGCKDMAQDISGSKDVEWYSSAMQQLIDDIGMLSQTKNIDEIMGIVRIAARTITGADGATFVLRDSDQCYYAEENAVSPLWKGQRFPMKICISGWVMQNAKPVVIEDIYNDSRIPVDAYSRTFVKSLTMVPIRRVDPVGAIGNYWSSYHRSSDQEIAILQALADATAVAIENAALEMPQPLPNSLDEIAR